MLCKVFANNSSADIKLLRTQLTKMVQLGEASLLLHLLLPLYGLVKSFGEEIAKKKVLPKSQIYIPKLLLET